MPPKTRMFTRTRLLVLAILILAGTASWEGYVLGIPAPSRTSTIEPGSLTKPCNYIIYQDGSTFLANSATTGANQFSEATLSALLTDTMGTNIADCFQGGTYTAWGTAIVTVSSPGFTVQGLPYSKAVIITPAADVSTPSPWKGLFTDTSDNFTIANIILNGINMATTPAVSVEANNFVMWGVRIQGFVDTGINAAVLISGSAASPFGALSISNVQILKSEFAWGPATTPQGTQVQIFGNAGGQVISDLFFEQDFFHDNQGSSIIFGHCCGTVVKRVVVTGNQFKNNEQGTQPAQNFGDVFDQQKGQIVGMTVTANTFYDDLAAAKGVGVGVYGSQAITINSNDFYEPLNTNDPLIAFGATTNPDDGFQLVGNTLYGGTSGIDFDSSINGVVSANDFAYNNNQPIGSYGTKRNIVISDNTIVNGNTGNCGGSCNPQKAGISVGNGGPMIIRDNVFLDNRTTAKMLFGVEINFASTNITVIGNNFRGVGTPVQIDNAAANFANPTNLVINNDGLTIGKITNPFATGYIGAYGTAAAPSASTTYTLGGAPIWNFTSSGGTGVVLTIKDSSGNCLVCGAATITGAYLALGDTINFGGFSVAPTVKVYS